MDRTQPVLNMLALFLAPIALYIIGYGIRRLYFHRISHIPGPRLAALTYLYQAYYDLFPYQDRWLFHQIELHARYGPIVRVGPDEVHISDPEFYTELSGEDKTKRRNKTRPWYWFVDAGDVVAASSFATLDAGHHGMRRRALQGCFNAAMVRDLESKIVGHIQQRTRCRLLKDTEDQKTTNLLPLMSALTLDVITEYSFGKGTDIIDTPELGQTVRSNIERGIRIHPFARVLPTLTIAMMKLVDLAAPHSSIARKLNSFDTMVHDLTIPEYAKAMHKSERALTAEDKNGKESVASALAQSDLLPPSEKTLQRIVAEVGGIIGGGAETTARTLAIGLYYILADSDIHSNILAELRTLMPRADSALPTVAELERLPYLTASIHKATRLAHGVAGRLVRTSPEADILYEPSASMRTGRNTGKPCIIPRGTTFSMSHYIQHTDTYKFPEPHLFKPERYLGESAQDTLKYLVPSGRGLRACLRQNLAWSMMYLCFAALLGGTNIRLAGTTERDVTIVQEIFVGLLPGDSMGIRVAAQRLEDHV
ncbi:putative cytochrome P450 [Septoria linicola]|nr:putative cytochrome P450 [Septoria linicola]